MDIRRLDKMKKLITMSETARIYLEQKAKKDHTTQSGLVERALLDMQRNENMIELFEQSFLKTILQNNEDKTKLPE